MSSSTVLFGIMCAIMLGLELPFVDSRKCPSTQTFAIGSYNVSPYRPEFSGTGVTILRQRKKRMTRRLNFPVSLTNDNPTYLAVSPYMALSRAKSFIYAANSGFPTGTLTRLTLARKAPFKRASKRAVQPADTRASYVSVSRFGVVFVSNTAGGTVLSFNARTLKLLHVFKVPTKLASKGVDKRQDKPGPHMTYLIDNDRRVVVPDLGTDLVFIFKYNRDRRSASFGKLKEVRRIKLNLGDGPRHVVQHAPSKNLFVINELSQSITTLCYNKGFKQCQKRNLLSQGKVENGAGAAIRITRNQKFIYTTTRTDSKLIPKHGIISGFRVSKRTGKIIGKVGQWWSGGAHPRDFNIVYDLRVDGKCRDYIAVANRDSNNVVFFRLFEGIGLLGKADFKVKVGTPSSVLQLKK